VVRATTAYIMVLYLLNCLPPSLLPSLPQMVLYLSQQGVGINRMTFSSFPPSLPPSLLPTLPPSLPP